MLFFYWKRLKRFLNGEGQKEKRWTCSDSAPSLSRQCHTQIHAGGEKFKRLLFPLSFISAFYIFFFTMWQRNLCKRAIQVKWRRDGGLRKSWGAAQVEKKKEGTKKCQIWGPSSLFLTKCIVWIFFRTHICFDGRFYHRLHSLVRHTASQCTVKSNRSDCGVKCK